MRGHIQQRGVDSWRLKFDAGRDPATGKRATRYVTFRGTKREAQQELARLIAQVSHGTFVEPDKVTVAGYLRQWITDAEALSVSPKTGERYRQLIERQIIPHLGAIALQKLRPAHIASWHAKLLQEGRHDGTALSARSTGHAHRVLHKALEDAVGRELLLRNPVSIMAP